jgi:hypothetical protein
MGFVFGLACGLTLGILFATGLIGVLVLSYVVLLLLVMMFFVGASR